MVAIGWSWKSIEFEFDNAQKLVEDHVKFAHEIAYEVESFYFELHPYLEFY